MAEEVSVVEYSGTPIAKLGRYDGASEEYQTIVSWTVPSGKTGVLFEVSMVTSNFAKTHFKLTIGSDEQFSDKKIQAALTLPWKDNKLAAATVVLLEAKSTDGTAIVVDGSITGKTLEYE